MRASAARMEPHLETELEGKPAVVLLGEVTTVGRQADNTLALRKHELSRVHFKVTRAHGGFQLESLSDAGTQVNGIWVLFTTLRDGDVIEAGRLKLVARLEGSAAEPPRPWFPLKPGVALFPGDDSTRRLDESATFERTTDAQRAEGELLNMLTRERPERAGDESAEVAALREVHARLLACEGAARAVLALSRARDVFPAIAQQLLQVLRGDVAAVLSSGEQLERLALVRGEGAGQRLDWWQKAAELAEQKSGWVTASRPTEHERPGGGRAQQTMLAFSTAFDDRLLIFYCEAHRRPRAFDRDDADSMKRLAYAAVAALELIRKRRERQAPAFSRRTRSPRGWPARGWGRR